MLSEEQEKKREIRRLETVNEFLKMNGNVSDVDLSTILNQKGIETSSSTVGRDLSEDWRLTRLPMDVIEFIDKKRTENKLIGEKNGGINSQTVNFYIKDSDGKFNGCRRK